LTRISILHHTASPSPGGSLGPARYRLSLFWVRRTFTLTLTRSAPGRGGRAVHAIGGGRMRIGNWAAVYLSANCPNVLLFRNCRNNALHWLPHACEQCRCAVSAGLSCSAVRTFPRRRPFRGCHFLQCPPPFLRQRRLRRPSHFVQPLYLPNRAFSESAMCASSGRSRYRCGFVTGVSVTSDAQVRGRITRRYEPGEHRHNDRRIVHTRHCRSGILLSRWSETIGPRVRYAVVGGTIVTFARVRKYG
jgi:hypothetical protein